MENPSPIDSHGEMKFKIYMVGFPSHTSPSTELASVVDVIRQVVPKASVSHLELERRDGARGGGDKIVPVFGSVNDHFYAPDWVMNEAVHLLEAIKSHAPQGEVLLAGYGLGGIIVKQAVIVANTTPTLYNLSFQISSLVFFGTPHESTARDPWEGLLLPLIKTTPSAQLRESLFPAISSLARHVSELCDVFLRFEARYRVENVVPSGVSEFESSEEEKHTTSRKSRQWPSTGEIGFSAMDHIASIEQLRACFAPVRRGKMTAISSDEYFKALKVLSRSSHFIHDAGMAPNAYHYSGSLWAIYGPEIRRILLHEVRGGCVQVTAANGTGKSAVIKLVSQHLRTQSPLVVVDNFCVPLLDPDQPIPLYSVLVSTLHQILSQKPSLFSPSVQIFMSEMIRKNSWNEEMVAHLLSVLFTTSRNTDFLIVIHDYDSPLWPEATRKWWSSLPNLLAGSAEEEDAVDSSYCTLLMSSDRKGQATVSQMNCHQLDLSKDYESKKQRFVEEACTRMLAEVGLTTLGLLQSARGLEFVKEEIISRATGFSGSFSATSGYLSHLLRCCCTLSTPEAILQSIVSLPQTTGEFCRYQLRLLSERSDNVLPWATSVLSWVSLAARPLRSGELAMAAALRPDQKSMGESDVAVSLDIEADIRANLAGILCVENGFVRITNPIVRVALLDGIPRRGKDNTGIILKLMGDREIVLRCLNYLSILFTQPPGSSNDMDEALLDYTIRYWPVHFSRVENPDEELCEKVAAFLDDETAADKWFRLYLELNCLPPNFPFTDNESGNPKVPPAVMASLTGLQEALSHLRPARSISTTDVYSPRKILARRGSWEHEMVFLNDLAASQLFLEHAIGTNDLTEVVALLSESSPHRNNTIDNRPLHLAAFAGSPRMVEVLVGDAGVWESASVVDQEGRTALHWAALGGRCDVIKMLVNKSLPSTVYESQDANSETALLLATRAGNELAARVLMEHGEKDGTVRPLDLRDKMGRQPIHHAVISCPSLLRHGSPMAAVKTLLEPDKDGFTALHIAAYSGCVDATSALLNIASKLSSPMEVLLAKDTTGKQPLHHAAEQGHVEVLSLLLKYKNDWVSSDGHSDGVSGESASLDQNDPSFATPGDLAARHGHLDALRKLHSPGEELGSSILAEAAGAGQLLIVQHLLLDNANPDGKSRSGDTPLGLAATGGFSQIVRSLLKRGADVNLPNRKRQTPLYLAVEHKKKELAKILLDHKGSSQGGEAGDDNKAPGLATINAPDLSRLTPLHVAASAGEADLVRLLLEREAIAKSRASNQQIPLHLAVKAGCLEAANLLMESYGAGISAVDDSGQHPVQYAIQQGNLDMVKMLLSKVSRNEDDNTGVAYSYEFRRRDFEIALKCSATSIFKFLLERFPEMAQPANITDRDSDSLLHVAARSGDAEAIRLLLRLDMDVNMAGSLGSTAMHIAVSSGNLEVMKALLEGKPDLEREDSDGETPLLRCAFENCSEENCSRNVCRLLLDAGAQVDNPGHTSKRWTPLFACSSNGNINAAKVLLEYRADPNCRDSWSWSCLHTAADRPDFVRELLAKGADMDYQLKDGWTALHLSCDWLCPDAVELLLENGANPNILNNKGNSPLDIVILSRSFRILQVMIAHNNPGNPIDFTSKRANGLASIHLASKVCDSNFVKELSTREEIDVRDKTTDGLTCLDLTCMEHGRRSVFSVLLDLAVWDYQDLVSAYWRAVGHYLLEHMDLLLNKDSRLMDEVSTASGINGLRAWFMTATGPSRAPDVDLTQVQDPREGFRALRYATESTTRAVWNALMSSNIGLGIDASMHDEDGWTLHDFRCHSAARLEFPLIGEEEPIRGKARGPTRLVLPDAWKDERFGQDWYDSCVKFGKDDLQATLQIVSSEFGQSIVSVRSDRPFPPLGSGDSYFEIQIEDWDMSLGPRPEICAIGFCGELTPLVNAIAGWKVWSAGYHGDDGGLFQEGGSPVESGGKLYGPGDTVGCGVDYENKGYFFTRNGEVIYRQPSELVFRKVYPCFCFRDSKQTRAVVRMKANFGRETFVWDGTKPEGGSTT